MDRWQDFMEAIPSERVSRGNRVTHLVYDDKILQAIWAALEEAEERIWMSMYTIKPDEVGRRTLARLTEAARRGCEVLLVCDYFGSFGLRERDLRPLREAGGEVLVFNRVWPPSQKNGRLSVRDHRKLIIVDDRRALCGGFNMTNAYAENVGRDWQFDDTMAELEGPCVHDLAAVFMRTWRAKTGEGRPLALDRNADAGSATVAVLEVDPRRSSTMLPNVLRDAIDHAEDHLRLSTPYFVPPDWLHDALVAAADRGVDVRILTAGETDRAVARWAGWYCYAGLLRHGIRVFELFGRVLHSKTLTVDGRFGSIGSYNMDAWTSRHTLDLNVVFADKEVASSLDEEFNLGVEDAEEITTAHCDRQSWLSRRAHQAVYYAYRWL